MTVNDIFLFLDNLYPTEKALDFDNVGILVGDKEASVSKVLISLDCTLETVDVALNNGCQLIITHHPVIFGGMKNVLSNSIVYKLIKNSVSVISMHTNLDVAIGGVNSCLCEALELKNISVCVADDGFALQYGLTKPTTADDFADYLKSKLGGVIKYTDGKRKIEKVILCSGSGGDYIDFAIDKGFDAFVTADVKHHHFLQARDFNLSLFDAGHFNTEDVVVEPLKKVLQDKFEDVEFLTAHETNIKFK